VTEACRGCPARLVEDAGHLLGQSFNEVVPAEAQHHLSNAQRELLLAIAITLEHNARRGTSGVKRAKRRGAPRAPRRPPSQVELE